MNHIEILRAAKELLSDETKWTKEHFAVDANGHGTLEPWSEDSCQWCLWGATAKVNGGYPFETDEYVDAVVREISGGEFTAASQFNDHPDTTHADVLRVLDLAIERASNAVGG